MAIFRTLILIMILSTSSVWALEIVVTLPPFVEGVQAIAPPGSFVTSLIKPGDDPDSTALSVAQIRRLEKADLIISSGKMPFEMQLADRCNQDSKLRSKLFVLFAKNDPAIKAAMGTTEGDHFHSGDDPHVWMSPRLYRVAIQRVAGHFNQTWPNLQAETQSRLAKYEENLESVQKTNRQLLGTKSGETLLIFHPSLGYLCNEYKIRQLSIEQRGESPSGKYLMSIVSQAKKAHVKAVFIEVGGSNKQAKSVAEALNVPLIPLNVMAPNYSGNLKTVVKRIADNI